MKRYTIDSDVRSRDTQDGRTIITRLGARVNDVQHVILENDSARALWRAVCASDSLEQVVRFMMDDYGQTERAEIEEDVTGFLEELAAAGFLLWRD